MSRYLIDRIEATSNITILCETEIVQLIGAPDQGLHQRALASPPHRGEEEPPISTSSSSSARVRTRPGYGLRRPARREGVRADRDQREA